MIKSEKGIVTLDEDKTELVSDYVCIMKAIVDTVCKDVGYQGEEEVEGGNGDGI